VCSEVLSRKEPEPPSHFETLAQGSFVRHDDAEYTSEKGRRVMRTMTGGTSCVHVAVLALSPTTPATCAVAEVIPPGTRDLDMLASAGVAQRAPRLSPESRMDMSQTLGTTSATSPAAVHDDFPISYYTQMAARGTNTARAITLAVVCWSRPGLSAARRLTRCGVVWCAAAGVPGMTAATGANPFLRDSKFTTAPAEHSDMKEERPAWATAEVLGAAPHAGESAALPHASCSLARACGVSPRVSLLNACA
jgi:hypothetical protein